MVKGLNQAHRANLLLAFFVVRHRQRCPPKERTTWTTLLPRRFFDGQR